MRYIEIKAPAKINIGLKVLQKRTDGFHDLSTLFFPINDLYDTLLLERSPKFEFVCNCPGIPTDETNLVVKAKNMLEKFSSKKMDVKIELIKNIPTQAGLGGGSSDAAAALISLNEMFELKITYEKMLELALHLGSDVPFFIKAKPSIASSRGEKLKIVDLEIEESILVVNPKINISTKEAFSNIIPNNIDINYSELIVNNKLEYSFLERIAVNDFENNIFKLHPEIEQLKKILLSNSALFASMSGTGSTVYGIFKDRAVAENISELLPEHYFKFISTPHM